MPEFLSSLSSLQDDEFNFLKDLIYQKTGIFLAPHKKIMVQSRLNSRLRHHSFTSFKDYIDKLRKDKDFFEKELTELINRITTNKTDFFRENHHFEFLRDTYFPFMEEESKHTGVKTIRIWSSAASTGEEPYSIAITAAEYFENKPGWNVKILASDIDTNVLATAMEGMYRADRISTVPEKYLIKYFTKHQENDQIFYKVKPILKQMIEYRKINLLETPYPLGDKMDMIFCRNVIIYFDKPTQRMIFQNFENVLKPYGFLIIGHSETMFGISDKFKFLGQTIYQKKY